MKDEGRDTRDELGGIKPKEKKQKAISLIPCPSSFDSKRIVTGLVLLTLALVVLFVPYPLPLTILVWFLGVMGLWEYSRLIEVGELPRLATSFFTFTLLIVGCYFKNLGLVLSSLCLPFVWFVWDLFMFSRDPESWPERQPGLGLFVAGPIYLGLALGLAVHYKVEGNLWPLIFVASCVWTGDTGAYYIGRVMGKHLLHPISPNKTWEGTISGLVVGAMAAMVVGLIGRLFPWWEGLILGILVNLSGQMGDLLESFLKRVAGVKDSGTIFPGHGGVLDRIDSLLLALPSYAVITGVLSLLQVR